MSLSTTFRRRALVLPPSDGDRPTIGSGDLGRFLSAFVGGLIFFSILIF